MKFLSDHVLFILTLFLLAFIPLYPKLPILDIQHTWVYVRLEDFLVFFIVCIYGIQVLRKKAYIKTPLTIPFIVFWVMGGIATAYGIFFIFPHLQDVFPSVAVLSFLRRIEYLSLFFVAYSAMKKKSFAKPVVVVLAITLLLVVFYGLGQKGFIVGEQNRFPAFLTMNEEFAKGVPLKLSALARIPSTFAGHYDLAAYLVLVIPIMAALIFGVKKWWKKAFFFFCAISGLVLLLLTASRTSFVVYLATLAFLFFLLKKKAFIIPVIIFSIVFAQFFSGISQRFGSTISQVDLVVDARTGKAIGIAQKGMVIEDEQSTGENLPKGTAYIKLPSSSKNTSTNLVYKKRQINGGEKVTSVEGNFQVQKVLAYDVSFTTRFQGEWPRAIDALKRNILLGSGYSSISLATDNNYLRILGEIGTFGFLSFFAIFLITGIYVKKVLPHVDDPFIKTFVIGTMAGIFGLGLNAILIDVFEASKVAFVLWMLLGSTLGLLHLYKKDHIDYFKEITAVLTSIPAIIIYLILIAFGIFGASFSNFFMGDDFTWLRWAADCKKILDSNHLPQCQSTAETIRSYFLSADGFFYRPGTKIYFYFMYAFFGLYASAYHVFSLIAHLITGILAMFISLRFLKNKFFAFLVGALFILVSSHAESVFWIAATGHIIAASAVLFALLMYIYWKDTKQWIFLLLSLGSSIFGMFFHEFGIVTPLLIIFYDIFLNGEKNLFHLKKFVKNFTKVTIYIDIFSEGKKLGKNYWYYSLYLLTIPAYLKLRAISSSHWFSGDYNYKLSNLPFNFFGNLLGYIALAFVGSSAFPFYEYIRVYAREHLLITVGIIGISLVIIFGIYFLLLKKIAYKYWETPLFGFGFFVITLLTFLGLGNITIRYVYLPSFGLLLIFVYLLQIIYTYLEKTSKILAGGIIAVILLVFSYYHYLELQRINTDWNRAGNITGNMMRDFNQAYQVEQKTPQNPVFYFVNVPIKTGEAWIFPVGLEDSLWFTFQNDNLTVHTAPTVDIGLQQAEGSISARVFEFDKNGVVSEVQKIE